MERPFAGSFLSPLAPFIVAAGCGAATLLALSMLPTNAGAWKAPPSPTVAGPRSMLVGRYDVEVDTLAGGEPGYRDGPAWQARFSGPNALALDPDGALLVCDSRNHRVRRITESHAVETVIGGGATGGSGGEALGPASRARLRYPAGVTADGDGVIYIADTGNHRLCRFEGGTLSLLAGGARGHRDGTGAAAAFTFPSALHLDESGVLWVLDDNARRIRRVTPQGSVSTTTLAPAAVLSALGVPPTVAEQQGRISGWMVGGQAFSLFGAREGRRSPSAGVPFGRLSYFNARTRNWDGLEMYADAENHVIMAARTGDAPMVVAGRRHEDRGEAGSRDGNGETATFSVPAAVLWKSTTLHVADYEGNRVRRLTLPGWLLTGEQPN